MFVIGQLTLSFWVQKQSFMVNQRDFAIKEKKGTNIFGLLPTENSLSQKDILPEGEMNLIGVCVQSMNCTERRGGGSSGHHFQISDGLL